MSHTIFNNKTILITGGSGSLGSALSQKLIGDWHEINGTTYGFTLKRIIIFSRRWQNQQELRTKLNNPPNMRWFIGDVRDKDRLVTAMKNVDYVIHAAAMKAVDVCEYNPVDAIQNNILGTQNVLHAALEANVKKVLFVSSDKGCNPYNLYGKTKSVGESLTVAYNAYATTNWTPNHGEVRLPAFACVRYGNVVGSAGSVIPIFQQQAESGVITITNPNMTRFWITMDEAITLILNALVNMRGGETYIPKLKACTILQLAQAVAPNAQHNIIGERPGEKLHEILLSPEEVRSGQVYDMRWAYQLEPQFPAWDQNRRPPSSKHLPPTFQYSSNTTEQLDTESIQKLIP